MSNVIRRWHLNSEDEEGTAGVVQGPSYLKSDTLAIIAPLFLE